MTYWELLLIGTTPFTIFCGLAAVWDMVWKKWTGVK